MSDYPTHVTVDGAIHTVALVEQHEQGPAHTHRVHLGCGMTVDVDIGGVRAHARALERLGHVQNERDQNLKWIHEDLHTKAAKAALINGETWKSQRWSVGNTAKGCAECEAHEAGAQPQIKPINHMMPTTRQADIDVNMACPTCGSKVYKRRNPEVREAPFACSGQGHEFTGPELMQHIKLATESLMKHVKE